MNRGPRFVQPVSWHDTASRQIDQLSTFGDMRPDAQERRAHAERQAQQRRSTARQARRSRRALRDTVIEFAPAAVVLLVLLALGIIRRFA